MGNPSGRSSRGQKIGAWLAGIAATVVAGVLTFVILEAIRETPSSGPEDKTRDLLAVPHAPPIEPPAGEKLFDEQLLQIRLQPGQKKQLRGLELFSAPTGARPSCATGFIRFTWQVREPYPYAGSDFELHSHIPRGRGRTELVASLASGAHSMGYCSEMDLYNTSLVPMTVEVRYASGLR